MKTNAVFIPPLSEKALLSHDGLFGCRPDSSFSLNSDKDTAETGDSKFLRPLHKRLQSGYLQ